VQSAAPVPSLVLGVPDIDAYDRPTSEPLATSPNPCDRLLRLSSVTVDVMTIFERKQLFNEIK
jgi:hypothetical protein